MSREEINSVAKSVETLLTEAKQIRNRCKQQNADARVLMEELRQENCELVQRYQQAEQEMEQVKKALGELMATKAAFDARERQLREAI